MLLYAKNKHLFFSLKLEQSIKTHFLKALQHFYSEQFKTSDYGYASCIGGSSNTKQSDAHIRTALR